MLADEFPEMAPAMPRYAAAYQYATIYAQCNPKALEWLETAIRMRDPGLARLKIDSLLDPLRKEPRFQALIRQLKLPN